MCPCNQWESIVMTELFNCISSEDVPCSSSRNWPSLNLIRVRPQNVAHYSFLRDLFYPVDFVKITNLLDVGWQASMHTKYLIVNNCSKSQTIEDFGTASPNVQASVLSDTFIIKSVNLSDDSALMVSSEKSNSVFISDFQSDEQQKSLDTIFSTIDIISHENVIWVRREPTNFKQLK